MSDHQMRVLIVEDDPDDHLIIRETLRDAFGADVTIAWVSTAHEAEEALVGGEYDAALVDYYVNPASGLDLIALARKAGIKSPLILLTGLGDSDVDLAAEQAGASDYIEKTALNPTLIHRTLRYAVSSARASRALAETTGMLDMTLEHTGLGIASTDSDGQILTINSRLRELVDDVSGEDGGRTLLERLNLRLPLTACIHDVTLPDGRVLEVACREVPGGGSVIVCGDVTDRRRQEEMLLAAKNAAEAASRAKTEFLANISHELRTPLNAIIGFSELLLSPATAKGGRTDPRTYLEHIHGSGQRLLEMVNDVISLTTLDMAQGTMIEDEIDIASLFRKVAATLAGEIERNGQRLQVEIDPAVRVWADPRAIRHIILHLVRNAVRFSGEGSTIIIRSGLDETGRFALCVEDNGIGIPEAVLGMMGETFVKGEGHLMKTDGLGIGLNLVRRLSDIHGGTFGIFRPESGKGTAARVTLPPLRAIQLTVTEREVA